MSLELSSQHIAACLLEITRRQFPPHGHRQVPFNDVETLLCYGLFYVLDPHKYGGANIKTVPSVVQTLAMFFRRTPGSITNKMLNLDGSRQHSAREEPLLFASLAASPTLYRQLYRDILSVARTLSISENLLPDFLHAYSGTQQEGLAGQDDLPQQSSALLAEAEDTMKVLDRTFALGDLLTEKLVEQRIRLAQHRFATSVLQNYEYTCVFCGFSLGLFPIKADCCVLHISSRGLSRTIGNGSMYAMVWQLVQRMTLPLIKAI